MNGLQQKQEDLINNQLAKENWRDIFFIKSFFLIYGIGSMLPWNSILASIGFFEFYLPTYIASVSFPFLKYFLNIGFQFYLLFNERKYSYKCQLVFSLILTIIFLLLLPGCALVFNKELYSFILVAFSLLVQGYLEAVCLNAFFALESFFPEDTIILTSTGMGLSGILINILQIIILFSLPSIENDPVKTISNLNTRTWIFFSISSGFLVISGVFLLLAYKNHYFLKVMTNTSEVSIEIQNMMKTIENNPLIDFDSDTSKTQQVVINDDKSYKGVDKSAKAKKFLYYMVKLKNVNISITVNYVITFTVFPGACLRCPFFNLDTNLAINAIILLFNIFDTIGRKVALYIHINSKQLLMCSFIRVIFIISIPLNSLLNTNTKSSILICSIVMIFNISLFALTNGLSSSLCCTLAPMELEEDKGKAGESISFFIIFGIFIGTCTAFGMNAILDAIKA